ncbi:CDP-alcohol phosphatidyltransferase family protein [Dokdonia sp. Hel_I_53]|uniref:CDP-alcohol phosphatidyltransferase family protein n=1 Tax=Dokdonia sp. Hel_I_53 TaxID=1566287 RepID=UPI0011993E4C|nr:CDP-alcohol phosphatidyltransferase family protein [Dokdonia sp. Hel_I_53]TVZ51389.1 CDP-alcohol phosphatidyltransferase-like enzyme [Dokdonia sp. Hel_I_53]
MSKLPASYRFVDLSDYGRPVAKRIAQSFQYTKVNAIHVTWMFIVAGLAAIASIYFHQYRWALLFLLLKSTLDAADGELARLKKQPSYTGRYFDSIADIVLNAAIFYTLFLNVATPWWMAALAFVGMQLQGTLYNYYYVILRNQVDGDLTSQIFETSTPTALPGEKQATVTLLYRCYRILYGGFDAVIYRLDPSAPEGKILPKYLMTAVSTFGLGFQLAAIGLLLVLGFQAYIIPFFMAYTGMILVFILLRKRIGRNV